MVLQLSGKRARVTDSSRGIGKAIARVPAQQGCDVALLARQPQALAAATTETAALTGRRVVGVAADTSSDAPLRQAMGSMRHIAVAALTQNLADEPGRAGIQMRAVHPGLTRPERTAARAPGQGVDEAAIEAQSSAGNANQRRVMAEESAEVVAFLCSPRSRAFKGDVIAAGGGAPRSIHY